MPTPNSNAPERLRQVILEEARREKEALLHRARQQADAIVAKADKEAGQFRRERLDAARAEAKRRSEAILATVPVEVGRRRLAQIEVLLQAIHDQAGERLRVRSGFDLRQFLIGQSAEALRQMAGDAFQLRLSVADRRALGDGLVAEIQQQPGCSSLKLRLVADAELKDGDALVEDEAGSQVWNLSPPARLERCWPELRRQIAAHPALLEQGTA